MRAKFTKDIIIAPKGQLSVIEQGIFIVQTDPLRTLTDIGVVLASPGVEIAAIVEGIVIGG